MDVTSSENCIYKDLTVQQLPWMQKSSQILKNTPSYNWEQFVNTFLQDLIDTKF